MNKEYQKNRWNSFAIFLNPFLQSLFKHQYFLSKKRMNKEYQKNRWNSFAIL
jgi:hypothetical protein